MPSGGFHFQRSKGGDQSARISSATSLGDTSIASTRLSAREGRICFFGEKPKKRFASRSGSRVAAKWQQRVNSRQLGLFQVANGAFLYLIIKSAFRTFSPKNALYPINTGVNCTFLTRQSTREFPLVRHFYSKKVAAAATFVWSSLTKFWAGSTAFSAADFGTNYQRHESQTDNSTGRT